MSAFCDDCPDHEACATGWPCSDVILHKHEHNPIQHRDGKPPWCRECGLTDSFQVPTSKFDRLQKHSRRRNRG